MRLRQIECVLAARQTKDTKVPDRPEWLHEVKHDGYRLIVQRDGKRLRLFTRNGPDWTDRFPLIASCWTAKRYWFCAWTGSFRKSSPSDIGMQGSNREGMPGN